MNYKRVYKELISNRKKNPVDGYTEKHHIKPKSLGGSDHKRNLVALTAREHFIAHRLLAKIHGGGMWYAANVMMHGICRKNKIKITSHAYSQIMVGIAKTQSKKMKGKAVVKNRKTGKVEIVAVENINFDIHQGINKGKTKETHAHVAATAGKLTGRTKETHAGLTSAAKKLTKWVYVTPWGDFLGKREAALKSPFKSIKVDRIVKQVESQINIHKQAVSRSQQDSILFNRHDLIGKPYSELGIYRIPNPEYTGC